MASSLDAVTVVCPRCGYRQSEPRTAYSTLCRKCQEHFLIQEQLQPAAQPPVRAIPQRRVRCFQCGAELEVPAAASSTMCKRCSGYLDLRDYRITQTVSKNFVTHGRLTVEENGYALNSEARVGEAVLKGRFIGKLVAERTLEIHSTARIKGSLRAACLVIPAGNQFRWTERLQMGGAEIAGELVANLLAAGTVLLKSTARLFGDIEAANLVVESGAVFVGAARIGQIPRASLTVESR